MSDERDIEKERSVEAFIATLRRVADALETGKTVAFDFEGERVTVPEHAKYSIEHEREDDDEEIEFQIKWSRG